MITAPRAASVALRIVIGTTLAAAWSVAPALAATPPPAGERIRPDGHVVGRRVSAATTRLAEGATLVIPAAAHLAGAAGTDWRTDLELHNPGTAEAQVTIALLARDQDNSQPVTRSVTLAPGTSRRFEDVLQSQFAFSGAAALRLTTTGAEVTALSRTFNDQPSGTYGQMVPALREEEAFSASEPARLIMLSESDSATGTRTNLGLVNLGSRSMVAQVALYDGHGAQLGSLQRILAPYGYVQLDRVFRSVTSAQIEDGYAIVTGDVPFLAYASVVDNRTGDPVFLPAERTPAPGPLLVPAAAHLAGAGGTVWRTDLELHNPGTTQCRYDLELLERDHDNSTPALATFQLDPGASVRYPDVLASVFSFSGAAALRISPSGCTLHVASRTFNSTPLGTYGQLVPAMAAVNAIPGDASARLIGLAETSRSRSNLGLLNAGSGTLQLQVELYDATGAHLGTVPSQLTLLRPYELRQLDRVLANVSSQSLADAYAVVSGSSPGGAFLAYASVVDNASGDPIFVPSLEAGGGVTVTTQFEETSYYLRGLAMLDSSTGWAVGGPHWDAAARRYVSTLVKTTDGGATWTPYSTGQTSTLDALTFVGTGNGWAVGGDGLVLHTADGGATWTRQTISTTDELLAVSFADSTHGWLTAVRPTHWDWLGDADDWTASVWHTDDGGASWSEQSVPADASILRGLCFVDAQSGWAVGLRSIASDFMPEHRMVVYRTADGGRTWLEQYAPDIQVSLTAVDFVNATTGWAVGFLTSSAETGGATFRTTDGGATWQRYEPGAFFDLLWDVEALDANRAYIVGANYAAAWGPPVFRTSDGGATWEKVIQERHDGDGLYALALVGSRALAVGDHDYVVESEDAWGAYGQPWGNNLFTQGYVNTHYKLEDVAFCDSLNGWAVGRASYGPSVWGQVILHTADGGAHWSEQLRNPPPEDSSFSIFRLDAVTFTDCSTGWAVGSSELFDEGGWRSHDAILHTSDGGLHWVEQGQELAQDLSPEFFDVQFLDSSHGWALDTGHYDPVAGRGALFLARTSDGGAHWSWVPTGIEGYLAIGYEIVQGGLHFTDAQNGWAVGGLGEIAHTSDGGAHWDQQTLDCGSPSCPVHLNKVDFTSATAGWIAGERGVFATVDGGEHWTTRDLGLYGDLFDVDFPTPSKGWAVGDGGVILRTTDGGTSWTRAGSGSGVSLLGLSCAASGRCWAVGEYGEILRIDAR